MLNQFNAASRASQSPVPERYRAGGTPAPLPTASKRAWALDAFEGTRRTSEPASRTGEPKGGGAGDYTVQPGDTLTTIATRLLGEAGRAQALFEANRDQLSDPYVVYPGMVLRMPGEAAPAAPFAVDAELSGILAGLQAPPAQPPAAPKPVEKPAAAGDPAAVVGEARKLKAAGYRYTTNLTTKFDPVRFKRGCCADFVIDAWAKAGADLYKKVKNPHYCPSLMDYLKNNQDGHQWVAKSKPAKPGDMIFFDWNGNKSPDHVGIVTAVDSKGKPTKVIESYSSGKPVAERSIGGKWPNVLGYGRM